MKDYKTIFAGYGFTDTQGHNLEHCADLLDLIDEHQRMRAALEFITTFTPSGMGYVSGRNFNQIHDAARRALKGLPLSDAESMEGSGDARQEN